MSKWPNIEGYSFSLATGYAQAINLAIARRIDIFITDIALQDGDGCELLQALRAIYPSLAGVAVTGYGEPTMRERCKQAGFCEFLLKPILFDQLSAAIQRVLARRQ